MIIKKIFPKINKKFANHIFSKIKFDSKKCKKNDIFFAIKGKRNNGNLFIKEAIKNGAKTIVSDKKFQGYSEKVLFISDNNPRSLLANAASKIYKNKPKNIIAVTGTNGKSSIADFYLQIVNLNKVKCSSIGTLGIKSKYYNSPTKNTTLDSISLNKILEKLHKKKINNIILEASSHGLHQHRLNGIKFKTGIFTNLTRDHLDYHKSYKNYLNSKLILFKKHLKRRGLVIYNNNLKVASVLKKISKKKNLKTLSIGNHADVEITRHAYSKNSQEITFLYEKKKYSFKTSLIGKIQITNLLMAALAASQILPMTKVVKSLGKVRPVNGRLEQIGKIKNHSMVILDYSHTPDALETCLKNIKEQFKHSNISLVFGCGGERDKQKREIMGRIANSLCDKIYLTDDNPRNENPDSIRKQVKKKISKNKLKEIPSRREAIKIALQNLYSGDILVVSGKGHEMYQEYKTRKVFSDKYFINKFIKIKNNSLSNYWKTNILKENLYINQLNNNQKIQSVSINSNKIKSNQIFVGLKGKKFDGNKFADQAIKNKAILSIVDRIYKKKHPKKIKVKNSLNRFSDISSKIRKVSNIDAIAVTGSAGKTSFKELLGQTLNKISPTTFSRKSFNNKFGVPVSLFEIDKISKFGVFEVGMDKKGEIGKLSKLINPDVGVITNISYAHIKNFKSLSEIAAAKSELIDKINTGGKIVLNKDDKFFNYLKKKALKKNLEIISFSKNRSSNVTLIKSIKKKNFYLLHIKVNKIINKFNINNNLFPYIENLLGTIAVLSIYLDLNKLEKNIFLNFYVPQGRGNISKIKLKNKVINLIDESYNSNPLSLELAIRKIDNLNIKTKHKKILLGDMLELGKFSKKLHLEVAKMINKSSISKVFVYGKYVKETFNKIITQKKGRILRDRKEIIGLIKNNLNKNDYLMIKGSNATGLNNLVSKIKSGRFNAL